MSLLTSVNETSKGVSSFLKSVPNIAGPNQGIQTNSTWLTTGVSGAIGTAILIPGLTPSNIVQVSTQSTASGGAVTQSVTDCINCWVITAIAGNGQISVYVANGGGGTNGAPVDNAHYGLAWSVIA